MDGNGSISANDYPRILIITMRSNCNAINVVMRLYENYGESLLLHRGTESYEFGVMNMDPSTVMCSCD
jgi:hypothetical protein